MIDINPTFENVTISLTKFKEGHSIPFKKNIVLDYPNGYIFDNSFLTIDVNGLEKERMCFIRCKNTITNNQVYFILTKSCGNFKFIDFIESKNLKKKPKIKKYINLKNIELVTCTKKNSNIELIVWVNENNTIHQIIFLKTPDKKWNLIEKRNIRYTNIEDIIIYPQENIIRLIQLKENVC